MKTHALLSIFIIAVTALIFTGTAVQADPLAGQVMKFEQLPLDGTVIYQERYYGHDEYSTIYGDRIDDGTTTQPGFFGQEGVYMADDFADNFDTPVVHVSWWGSYMLQNQTGRDGVQQFLISFEKDVPAVYDDLTGEEIEPSHPWFNHPENVHQLVSKDMDGILTPGSGTFLEKKITDSATTGALEDLYEYNAELAIPFKQRKDEVYWLKIVALVDDSKDNIHGPIGGVDSVIEWGWHNRDYTVKDTLASPVPFPGERIVGVFPGGGTPDGNDVPIWHFQDNAVQGLLDLVEFQPPNSDGLVYQNETNWGETHYVEPWDGPSSNPTGDVFGIGRYSKDLAFRLYTIPEPSSAFLMLGALLIGACTCRRRS